MATATPPTRRWMPESVYSTSLLDDEAQSYRSHFQDHDLTTADGAITSFTRVSHQAADAVVAYSNISPLFTGFQDGVRATFNLKSTLSQLGINVGGDPTITINAAERTAEAHVRLVAVSSLGSLALDVVTIGSIIGKLFAPPAVRRITSIEYVQRLLGRKDVRGQPIFIAVGAEDAQLVDGRVVIRVPVFPGAVKYTSEISGLFPTVGRALETGANIKSVLKLHRDVQPNATAVAVMGNFLMVRSQQVSSRTLFARVVDELLPAGLKCAASNVIEPSADMSSEDRTFVFVGESTEPLTHIPIELFSSECYREFLPMSLRRSLPQRADDPASILKAFQSCPQEGSKPACVFVTKGSILDQLVPTDWVVADPKKDPGHATLIGSEERLAQARNYIHQQCEYPVLTAIAVGDISSEGILLTRYFPSPILKSLILSREVVGRLRAVYFTTVSRSYGAYFSQEDRSTLIDLCSFGIRIYHVDAVAGTMFEFMRRGDTGLFVPLDRRHEYANATFFGVYGSNLVEGDFEGELRAMMQGILEIRQTSTHPYLNPTKPLALVTGGGPGAMEVGNRVAKSLGILSCGMFVDFGSLSRKPGSNINEQKKNPYVEAYMTYRPEKLVERQSEFNLDFPIFLTGGVGTDFEYALEEVRRKVGTVAIHPMVLFGTEEHFRNKIGARFCENRKCGVIKGSEWLSNVPYVVSSGAQALKVYRKFFSGTLPIGGSAPANDKGFVVVTNEW